VDFCIFRSPELLFNHAERLALTAARRAMP
jgi:hypothetical protein